MERVSNGGRPYTYTKDKLPRLLGVLTPEAQPIAYGVGE